MFRLAGILQGIMKRVVDGTAASAQAVAMGKSARPIAEQGWQIAQSFKGGDSRPRMDRIDINRSWWRPSKRQTNSVIGHSSKRFQDIRDTMDFQHSDKVKDYQARLLRFFDEHIYPNEHRYEKDVADKHPGRQSLGADQGR